MILGKTFRCKIAIDTNPEKAATSSLPNLSLPGTSTNLIKGRDIFSAEDDAA